MVFHPFQWTVYLMLVNGLYSIEVIPHKATVGGYNVRKIVDTAELSMY